MTISEHAYPEHEKVRAIAAQSQAIGAFLDWLRDEKRYRLCEPSDAIDTLFFDEEGGPVAWRESGGYVAVHTPPLALLAEYFGIDLAIYDAEFDTMIAEARQQ